MGIDWNQVIFSMLTIKGVYGREMYESWYQMSSLLRAGLDIKPVITHRMGYEDFEKAFEVMNAGDCGKVVLDWNG
jgi:threonine 3-dehydrogenase